MSKSAGYEEVLALEFFKRAIENYDCKRVDADLFGPLIRNLANESVILKLRDELIGMPTSEDLEGLPKRALSVIRRQREDSTASDTCEHLWNNVRTREQFRKKVLELTENLLIPLRERTANDPLRDRIAELKNTLHLTDNEIKVVLVIWLVNTNRINSVRRAYTSSEFTGFLNLCTGMTEQAVKATLKSSARLCRFGVISSRDRSELTNNINYFLDGVNDEPLASSFYKKDDESVLPMEFFGVLAKEHLPVLKQLLCKQGGRGLNILLYGTPGTGKSSFARALAKVTGRTCYQIAQRPKDRDGDYTAAKTEIRYAAIEICNEQVAAEDSLIIVDEADSLLQCNYNDGMFGRFSSTAGDKGLLNNILEKNQVPIIWITNMSANDMDLSNRRRFDYSIHFKPLNKSQRVDIWMNAAKNTGITELLTKKEIVELVERYPVNTGIVSRAFENAVQTGITKDKCKKLVETLLERQCELSGMDNYDDCVPKIAKDYSLEGLNVKSKVPLEKILLAAKRFLSKAVNSGDRDAPRMNILLSGVPGSGKTEFVKYLASELNRPLCIRRPSDLKSKWVGETEQNIARAFREAKQQKSILFFDEIDSFLDNREALYQSHDKSMVNEVLQQMESFGGVFVGTTNFLSRLDPAVARRFTFKIELDFLTTEGKRHFFKQYFGSQLLSDEQKRLDGIDGLTPGDFRTVRQEFYYLGEEVDNSERLSALEEEVRARTIGKSGRIGF